MGDIKSSAIVKYSATKSPSRYNELATNTNINSPPADWLQGRFATKEPWAPGQGSQRGKEFSSFAMANSYIDHVGKVDVITDAENVKKLLKMNFSKAPVSMMVHRVGRTLLIDNLDVYKHVLLAQEQDWKWLRQFIYENLLSPNVDASTALIPACGSGALKRKDIEENLMLSKFLYHSLDTVSEAEIKYDDARREKLHPTVVPDPLVSENDNFEGQNNFERNILWNFEDIRMLIGTDMPIFGGGTHPCVSLRLRDMKKPINVLTGIDYWLDQLMCTVPEVVMCYHLNGIVQRYEVVQTEDLPTLPGSNFSPELIRDVAQNILSFLKSNATKEGHTYWLFKGKDDDIVKLYDLTSVCKEYVKEKDANPFTLPVAVLLYRVAKNLLQKTTKSNPRKMSSTIYRLLTHCLDLMDAEKFPQVVGSVHYLLANLYITYGKPNEMDEKKDGGDEASEKEKEILDEFDDSFDQNDWYIEDPSKKAKEFQNATTVEDSVSSVSLDLLAGPAEVRDVSADAQTSPSSAASQNLNKLKFIPNCTNLEDCWQATLEHVLKGLECVKAFSNEFSSSESSRKCSETQVSAIPDEAIPLQYEPIRPADYKSKILPLSVRFPNATGWRLELTSLLLVKAISAYHLLADCACKLQNYGKALRYIKLSFLCYESSKKLIESTVVGCRSVTLSQCEASAQKLLPSLLVLCGDIHLVLSHQKATLMGKHIKDYNSQMYRDERIASQAKLVLGDEAELEYSWCASLSESIEQNLHLSTKCYEQACTLIRGSANALENKRKSSSTTSKNLPSASEADEELDCSTIILDTLVISKRLGNVKNELGVYYMNLSTALLSKEDDPEAGVKKAESCWHMSYGCFQEGIQIFNKINDKSNESLLNSNAGRLMRLCANAYVDNGKEFSNEEQHYLLRAIEMYQRALECVNPRSDNSPVWETVAWELSSVYFTFAAQLQDRPPLSVRTADEIEKEIVDLMQKSLRLVDSLDHQQSPKHAIYVYRASIIHHKLAAMYHRSYLRKERMSDRKAKQIKSLTDMHYQKASEGFKEIITECPSDFVRVQLERVALIENNLESVTSPNSKLKLCQQALQLILSCRSAFVGLCRKLSEKEDLFVENGSISANYNEIDENIDEETLNTDLTTKKLERKKKTDESLLKECQTLCTITIQRLQFLTKHGLMLIRTASIKDANQDSWKDAYAATLDKLPTSVVRMPSFALNMLEKLNKISLL